MNISSIIVKTAPEHLKEVLDCMGAIGKCEIHFHDESGKIVATIEGAGINEEMQKLEIIQNMPNVLSVNLAYSYNGKEPSGVIKQFKVMKCSIPDILKD